ncbi:MAG TPA: CcmD family protein [Chitinophagaceae bacterium]|nr:CcmD family protein [Chitinophagaceae bacterium]
MNKLKRIAAVIAMAMITAFAQAQNVINDNNDVMKSNGKIYVVMTVVIVIVLGLLLYLIRLDRKISKLEKE